MQVPIYERIIEHILSNKEMPYYSAERRLDPIFGIVLEEILSLHCGALVEFVTAEFPLKIDGSKQARAVDYLCKCASKKTVVFVELKTDKRSYDIPQLGFYLANKNWNKVIGSLKEMAVNKYVISSDRVKYYKLMRRLWEKGLVSSPPPEAIQEVQGLLSAPDSKGKKQRSQRINELVSSIVPASASVDIVYIGPADDSFMTRLQRSRVDFVSFEMLRKMKLQTSYNAEFRYLLDKLQAQAKA